MNLKKKLGTFLFGAGFFLTTSLSNPQNFPNPQNTYIDGLKPQQNSPKQLTIEEMMNMYYLQSIPRVDEVKVEETPLPKTYQAIKGKRTYDAVSYKTKKAEATILDDLTKVEISEKEKEDYSDDGITLGDFIEGDEIFSRIYSPSTKDYIGNETNRYLRRNIGALVHSQEMDPLYFFGIVMVPSDSLRKIESQKNEKIKDWSVRFVKDFKKDEDNFFELYVPSPPEMPKVEIPSVSWKPASFFIR